MIPYFRMITEKHTNKLPKNYYRIMPAEWVDVMLEAVIKKIGKPISQCLYLKLAERYSKMISGNYMVTLRKYQNKVNHSSSCGWGGRFVYSQQTGRVELEISGDKSLNYNKDLYRFCFISDKDKYISMLDRAKYQSESEYRLAPSRTKYISWFIYCELCGKVERKSEKYSSSLCRSCTCRMTHYNRVKKETVEVNRLLNKLKKVIKNESKRLTQEIS